MHFIIWMTAVEEKYLRMEHHPISQVSKELGFTNPTVRLLKDKHKVYVLMYNSTNAQTRWSPAYFIKQSDYKLLLLDLLFESRDLGFEEDAYVSTRQASLFPMPPPTAFYLHPSTWREAVRPTRQTYTSQTPRSHRCPDGSQTGRTHLHASSQLSKLKHRKITFSS